MNTDTQLKVQAYLDNELSPGEARKIAALLSSDADARALYAELRDTRETLAQNEPEVKLQESREFFWSKIERQILAEERLRAPRPAASWWMRILAPAAGAIALLALLISIVNPSDRITPTASNAVVERPLHEVEDLAPDVSTITFRSESEGVTVVWVSSQ